MGTESWADRTGKLAEKLGGIEQLAIATHTSFHTANRWVKGKNIPTRRSQLDIERLEKANG